MTRVDYAKLKTNLRLIVNRLKLLEKKKTELALKARREIAEYIQNGKEDRARIRVEHIIREDYLVEAMEMVEMYADLLLARFGLIQSQKELDPGLEEPISSILWVAPRLVSDVPEFREIADQFTAKYGKEFADYSRANKLETVNEKLMHKLGVQAPSKILVERYMIEIAKSFNLEFTPDSVVMAQEDMYLADNALIHLDGCVGPDARKPTHLMAGGGAAATNDAYGYCTLMPPPQQQPLLPGLLPPPLPATAPPPMLPAMPPVGQPPAGMPYGSAPNAPPYASGYSQQPAQAGMHRMPYDVDRASDSPPAPPYSLVSSNGWPNGGSGPAAPPPQGASRGVSAQVGPLPPKVNLGQLPDLPAVPSSLPSVPGGGSSMQASDVDFDDLTRRFEELKKKK